ncbi:ATP-dependent RNA helicase DDX3X [Nematocida sp. AWRm77]|nr:ATP-dependent RNA helicase DDX3X [Nematocida sp. AWRm77]
MNEYYVPPCMKKQKEIKMYVEEEDVRVKTSTKITTMNKFTGLLINSAIQKNMEVQGIVDPTLVQKYAIPIAIMGDDLLVCAPTGMGKTISFLVPAINALTWHTKKRSFADKGYADKKASMPQVLILTPTRELAMQIHSESVSLSKTLKINSALAYGGCNKYEQEQAIRKGTDILIGTPGRLQEFLAKKIINLSRINILILDEADRMLDMGFEKQIRDILEKIDPARKRQTMMFSATFPESVQKIAKDFFQEEPSEVHIGHGPLENIIQDLIYIEKDDHANLLKNKALLSLLEAHGHKATGIPISVVHASKPSSFQRPPSRALSWRKASVSVPQAEPKEKQKEEVVQKEKAKESRVVIFVEKKVQCREVMEFLLKNGINCTSIHGDKDQNEREEALRSFTSYTAPILVATSVAARGLDIPNICLVVNYIMPSDTKDYIHRIGRTGRAGKDGRAMTFLTHRDHMHASALIEILKGANQTVPAFLKTLAAYTPKHSDKFKQKSLSFRKKEEKGDKSEEMHAPKHGVKETEEESTVFKVRDISTLKGKLDIGSITEEGFDWDSEIA